VLTLATYTYGPLLGLFSFGLIVKRKVKDFFVPMIAISSPLLCYLLDSHSKEWFHGYQFGYELLVINALITMLGLWIFSTKKQV
jgi:mannitol-specific phosphotransferase system IIBC component